MIQQLKLSTADSQELWTRELEEPLNFHLSQSASVESSLSLKSSYISSTMRKGKAAFFMRGRIKKKNPIQKQTQQFSSYLHLVHLEMPPKGTKPVARHFKREANCFLIFLIKLSWQPLQPLLATAAPPSLLQLLGHK